MSPNDNGIKTSDEPQAPVAGEDQGARRSRANLSLIGLLVAGAAALFVNHSVSQSRTGNRLETACASILNVVNPRGSTFEKNGSSLSAGDQVVRMLYSVSSPDGQSKRMIILCAFDRDTSTLGVPTLVAVSLNGQELGPVRLSFLNRFWLRSEEATAALPAQTAHPAQNPSAADGRSG